MVEMLVVLGISAIAISAIVASLGFILRQSAQVGSQASIALQLSESIERMRPTIEQAVSCGAVSIANGTTALQCTMPLDTKGGEYVPYRVDAAGMARYRSGASYLFYLSDSTGSQSKSGTVLWRASQAKGSVVWIADSAWSLYYDGAGRLPSVSGFVPVLDSTGHRVVLQVTYKQTYPGSALGGSRNAGSSSLSVTRQFYYRNWQT